MTSNHNAQGGHDGGRSVTVKVGAQGYTTQVKTENHSFIADEPVDAGGDDMGPSPYDMLLSALGACTAITLRMYADRKEWDVKSIEVKLSHQKVHKEDCEDCDNPNARIDFIERRIALEGDLDDKQKKRMVQIANKCPVHKTLTGEIEVETGLL